MSAPKAMPPTLLCWPTTSKADIGMVEAEPSRQYSITCCCYVMHGSSGASDRMASDIELGMKQRCVIEFLSVENTVRTDIN